MNAELSCSPRSSRAAKGISELSATGLADFAAQLGISRRRLDVPKPGFVDYSGAAPILLPVSLLPHWRGFYVPAKKHDVAELEITEGRFKICDHFDFKNPKTDYARAAHWAAYRRFNNFESVPVTDWSSQQNWIGSPGGRSA